MELTMLIYIIGILPDIEEVAGGVIVISIALLFFIVIFTFLESDDSVFDLAKKHKVFMNTLMGSMLLSIITTIIIPSEKTMYMMAGAYATQQVYQSEEAKQLGNKMMKLIDKKMEQYIEEAEYAIHNIDTTKLKEGDK